MEGWLPKAETARNESECNVTLGYSQDFKKAISGDGVWSMFGKDS